MTTYVLVHGAWHGAWCWELLTPEIERRGHRSIAVELPCEDPDADSSIYADVVESQLPAGDDDVVVVGHSLGGLTIPLVAARRPVRQLVYLCGLLPLPGRSVVDQLEDEPDIFVPGFSDSIARDEAERSFWPDPAAASAAMYADCPPALAERAVQRFRLQARTPSIVACPLAELPVVDSISILARADLAIAPQWSRRASRERLGRQALELDGGHSPFLSRPADLADLLVANLAS